MKQKLLAFFFIFNFQLGWSQTLALKEVTLDVTNGILIWNGQVNVVPCFEPFLLKLSNAAGGPVAANITIYESTGTNIGNVAISAVTHGPPYALTGTSGSLSQVINTLAFHRFYYINVVTATQNTTVRVYSTALSKELVYFELFASVGDAIFSNAGLKKGETREFDHNLSIATGLKFRVFPSSKNPVYRPYDLYPRGSRWSFVVAAVINEVRYKSTVIKPLFIGLKPLVGLNYERGNFGITVGTVFGNQDFKSNQNSKPQIVGGLWIGLSFSAAVFQAFRSSIPLSNLPAGPPATQTN